MKNFPSLLRPLVAALVLMMVSTACAATPTFTVTRDLTPSEVAAAADAVRSFEATPAYLARVQAHSTQADSLRFEVFTSIESSVFDMGSRTKPLMVGERSGVASRVQIDIAAMMGPMLALSGLSRSSMNMTMVTDANALYLNAPMLAELAMIDGVGADPEFAWVRELAAGWGRIDAAAFGGSDLLADMGVRAGAGAPELMALLESVGEVLDGGTGEVRGVPVRIVHAQVLVADVLEQTGQDPDDLGFGSSEMDVLGDVSANIAVHVDDDGMVRRLEYTMDFGALLDGDPQLGNLNLSMWQRVDFFDYGTEIDIPIPTVWTDITDDLQDLLDELG